MYSLQLKKFVKKVWSPVSVRSIARGKAEENYLLLCFYNIVPVHGTTVAKRLVYLLHHTQKSTEHIRATSEQNRSALQANKISSAKSRFHSSGSQNIYTSGAEIGLATVGGSTEGRDGWPLITALHSSIACWIFSRLAVSSFFYTRVET